MTLYDETLAEQLEPLILEAFEHRALLTDSTHKEAVFTALEALTRGSLRVASQGADGWLVHAWLKKAILLYFALSPVELIVAGALQFQDKIKTQVPAGVRVVPPGVIRYGAHVREGCVVMPGYVNIGAYVDEGTMVDTWATVGSCAQIGKSVHLSGGVGIGGVLEPASAQPVIIEDGAFIGSRAVIVEGVLVEREAVIGAGVVLTASTPILDVSGPEVIELRGRVPARSVVIAGTKTKRFAAGEFGVPCALILGQRTESTDKKTSLESALREFNVSV
ncbi:MAG: 2,3,4,5-tetrahydropyridine-2,6-dicarboxylate N-succinyltransferase [Deltaproteobacteria bacterium]|nr:2,3,4,5-tetrahydropyridine-2,6-dicarboxylate N-succinyltransferase [Deltaproteobacteria bacterium]